MERIENKVMKNKTWMNEYQVWKLEDCEDQAWINEDKVLKQEG